MITVDDIVSDPDFLPPQAFQILRSQGQWVSGGFASTTTTIYAVGPVQQASDREISMLPEADRVGAIRAFWWTQPMFTTRDPNAAQAIGAIKLTGSGVSYVVSPVPTEGLVIYKNGLMLIPGVDYILSGVNVTFTVPILNTDILNANTMNPAQLPAVSDILVYDNVQYRVMRTYYDPGSRYWKAFGTRMAAS